MKNLVAAFLVLSIAACATTDPAPPPQTPAAGGPAASAPAPSTVAAAAPDAKTVAPTPVEATPAAPTPAGPPGTTALTGLPLLVTLPDAAVLEPGDIKGWSRVQLPPGKGTMTISEWNTDDDDSATLDAFQKFAARYKMALLAKSGSGTSYSATYKPHQGMDIVAFVRRMKVGDTEVKCLVNDLHGKDEVAAYDAICKSIRPGTL